MFRVSGSLWARLNPVSSEVLNAPYGFGLRITWVQLGGLDAAVLGLRPMGREEIWLHCVALNLKP